MKQWRSFLSSTHRLGQLLLEDVALLEGDRGLAGERAAGHGVRHLDWMDLVGVLEREVRRKDARPHLLNRTVSKLFTSCNAAARMVTRSASCPPRDLRRKVVTSFLSSSDAKGMASTVRARSCSVCERRGMRR